MDKVINGREIAEGILLSVKKRIDEINGSTGKNPKLVSLTASGSKDSEIYVNMQKRAAEKVGVSFEEKRMPETVTYEALIEEVKALNSDPSTTAIIIQKPLPGGIDHSKVISNILPEKDAEGIHPFNLGKILRREADIVPCTPGAIMKILDIYNVDLYGKEAVIIGHSAIVGKPLSMMLLNEMATTSICHIGTSEKGDIKAHARRADILVVAVGKAEMVEADWIRDGVIVIDVGINKLGNKIVGDVKFDEVKEKASMITPVPGGVGPVTVSILMRNILRAHKNQMSSEK